MKRGIFIALIIVCIAVVVPSLVAAAAMTQKWMCTVCGHVYDPAQGDPAHGVAVGTSFAKLPVDWVCPDCGAGKAFFEALL
jgi:rubredoxin